MLLVPSHPASLLAASWLSQLHRLDASLESDPTHPQAWHWRIQRKVLTFLVARYGGDPSLDWQAPARSVDSWFFSILLPGHQGKPPRTRQHIRQTLERIAAANRIAQANQRKNMRW